MNARAQQTLLIDYVLGRCDPEQVREVQALLSADKDFAGEYESLRRVFATLGTYPAEEPPEDLSARTMARVRAARGTEALLEGQRTARVRMTRTFSARDLVAVAAMLLLAVGILFPSLLEAHRRADIDRCAANVGQIGEGLQNYAGANAGALPASPSGIAQWLPVSGQSCASNSAGLFQLIRGGLVPPQAFQCPAAGGQSFVAGANMVDFPSSRTIDYSYQHSLNRPIRRQELAPVAEKMAILADANPVFAGGTFRPENVRKAVSQNHPIPGQNVLYLDMHVDWKTGCDVGVNGDNIWLVQGVYQYTGAERPASPTDSFLLPYPGR